MTSIDLNADVGEGLGDDLALFPFLSSCNISCGLHSAAFYAVESAIDAALIHGLRIGAHPSYPDKEGFGRRHIELSNDELRSCIRYQVAALKALVEGKGGRLSYVKPHGALYNDMAQNADLATTVILAIRSIDDELAVMGLAGSAGEKAAQQLGATFIAEAFADRRYGDDGYLLPRQAAGSVLGVPADAASQALQIALHQQVQSCNGVLMDLKAQSICLHGDNPAALQIAAAVSGQLKSAGITIAAG